MSEEKPIESSVGTEKRKPTRTDVLNLEILIDTKATGANIHTLKGRLALMKGFVTTAETTGKWNEEDLNDYERIEADIRKDLLN